MRLRSSFMPYALGASAALALCMPFLGSGCGNTACISLTQAQAASGKCPSMAIASARFNDPNCPGDITSVDGDGFLQGSLCCYPVTQDSSQNNGACSLPGGIGGSFGSGMGGFGSEVSTTTGIGTGGCATCNFLLQNQGVDPSQFCPGTATALMELALCACQAGVSCEAACSDSLCQTMSVTNSCLSCLFTDMSCTAGLTDCQSN